MKSKKTISKLKAEVWEVFSRYIRLRDCLSSTGSLEYGECITCDGHFTFNQLQAGHFISGRHNANLFSERGTNAQCKRCNCLENGRPLEYRRQIIRLYGEGADTELEEEAKQIKRFTIPELEALKVSLKAKIAEIEKEV